MARRNPDRRTSTRYDDYTVHVVGGAAPGFADLYHMLLTVPWWAALGLIAGAYLALNAVFATLFLLVGGVSNMHSFIDAFFFSVQTMGTIGYGVMAPVTRAANFLVVVESVTGLVVTALATGIVFVRFSRVRSKIRFVKRVAISPDQGVPNLTVRIGNERRAPIVDVSFRMTLIRTITTQEGVTMYRSENLKLVHDQTPILTSATLLRHVIDPESPMVADTPDTFAAADVELVVAVRGTDETSLQPVHARKNWSFKNLVWGARLSDVITETTPTDIVLDLRRFDDLEPSDPTPDFPYRADPETLRS